jgi:short subunit dehydrogenase-like uncharacterized protein
LCWVPTANQFALLYCGDKTGNFVQDRVSSFIGSQVKLTAKQEQGTGYDEETKQKKTYTFWCFGVNPTNEPFESPTREQVVTEVEKFLAPTGSEKVLERAR